MSHRNLIIIREMLFCRVLCLSLRYISATTAVSHREKVARILPNARFGCSRRGERCHRHGAGWRGRSRMHENALPGRRAARTIRRMQVSSRVQRARTTRPARNAAQLTRHLRPRCRRRIRPRAETPERGERRGGSASRCWRAARRTPSKLRAAPSAARATMTARRRRRASATATSRAAACTRRTTRASRHRPCETCWRALSERLAARMLRIVYACAAI